MPVITISRQEGSLGDEAARTLAEELGFHLVSREDIHGLAGHYDPAYQKDIERLEREGHPGFWEKILLGSPFYASLFAAVIYELASRGRVIILGRGAQVVLAGLPRVLRARVVAPTRVRVARVMERRGLSQEETASYLHHRDHERRELVRQIFRHDPRDWQLYHLVLNTGDLDAAGAVAVLRQAHLELNRVSPADPSPEELQGRFLGKLAEAAIRRKVLASDMVEASGEAGGVVTVSGHLPSEADRDKALELARQVDGVTQVRDQVKVSRIPALY
jgi:cytidylate kinase